MTTHGTVPPGWTEEAALQFEAATASREECRFDDARMRCLAALDALPVDSARARAAISREIALTFDLEHEPALALPWYEKARDLAPASALTSIVLFHCLYGLGRTEPALWEALRFCKIRVSEEYRDLFCDDFPDVPHELRPLHDQIRSLVTAESGRTETG